MSVIDTLKERGYLKQLSHEEEIKELLEKEKITFYIALIRRRTAFMWVISSRLWSWPICSVPVIVHHPHGRRYGHDR